jgi:hypothetical protein
MAGEHSNASGIVTDQGGQTLSNLDGSVTVIGERENAAWILSPDAHEIGDPMHKHARLPGTRASKHEHVRPLLVVRNDSLLNRVLQRFDDSSPGFG